MLPELTDDIEALKRRTLVLLKTGKCFEATDEEGTTTLSYHDMDWWLQRTHKLEAHRQYDSHYLLEDDALALKAVYQILRQQYADEVALWQAVVRGLA